MTRKLPSLGDPMYHELSDDARALVDAVERLEEAQSLFDIVETFARHAYYGPAGNGTDRSQEESYRWAQSTTAILWQLFAEGRSRAIAQVEAEEAAYEAMCTQASRSEGRETASGD